MLLIVGIGSWTFSMDVPDHYSKQTTPNKREKPDYWETFKFLWKDDNGRDYYGDPRYYNENDPLGIITEQHDKLAQKKDFESVLALLRRKGRKIPQRICKKEREYGEDVPHKRLPLVARKWMFYACRVQEYLNYKNPLEKNKSQCLGCCMEMCSASFRLHWRGLHQRECDCGFTYSNWNEFMDHDKECNGHPKKMNMSEEQQQTTPQKLDNNTESKNDSADLIKDVGMFQVPVAPQQLEKALSPVEALKTAIYEALEEEKNSIHFQLQTKRRRITFTQQF